MEFINDILAFKDIYMRNCTVIFDYNFLYIQIES